MPADSKDKKRIKPVIEEVVEQKPEEIPETPEASEPVVQDTEEPKLAETEEKKASPENKTNVKLVVIITVVSALVAAVVSGGVYVYLSGIESLENPQQAEPTTTPDSSPTPTATPTPAPEAVNVSEYSVQVLNGSGAIGAAGAGEDILDKAGFAVDATGNAGNYNFEQSVIQAKSGVPAEALNQAKKALEESDYEVEVGDPLPSSSKYDIVVTIGSK